MQYKVLKLCIPLHRRKERAKILLASVLRNVVQ